jgi:transcriptional regulator with PAS, ATPase and Fis domain
MSESRLPELLADYETIRRRAMQSLFESLDTMSEGTVVVDKNSRIVWINERYAARFGIRSPENAIGLAIEEVIPNSLLREVVSSGHPILLDILENKKESFVVTRLPLKDEDGSVIGAIGFALYDRLQSLSLLFSKYQKLQAELEAARRSLFEARRTKYTFSNFIGTSPASVDVKRQARRAARLDAPVLLLGETGTGKEVLAQAVHNASTRAHMPFVSVNVAAIPDTLLEAEFFGVAPGAYTGADSARDGKFQLAKGGTLFLDEIGDMPLQLQSKLLRVLQEHEFEPLGSNKVLHSDARIIAATSADLERQVESGQFRADLYYRLNVLSIAVPPLRERLADLELLCEAIMEEIALRSGQPQCELDASVFALFRNQRWRGNVRELRNVIERVVMLSEKHLLTARDFRKAVNADADSAPAGKAAEPAVAAIGSYAEELVKFERNIIGAALAVARGNVIEAAGRLGIGRATLYKKMAALGIHARTG